MEKDEKARTMTDDRRGGPPTLPLPPLWRLVVAAAAILGFLYFLYHYVAEREKAAGTSQHTTSASAPPG